MAVNVKAEKSPRPSDGRAHCLCYSHSIVPGGLLVMS